MLLRWLDNLGVGKEISMDKSFGQEDMQYLRLALKRIKLERMFKTRNN